MTQYAKLISATKVELYSVPSNVSLAYSSQEEREDFIKELAEAAGYKKYNPSIAPNDFYRDTYRETAKNVYQEWRYIELEKAKELARAIVDAKKEDMLNNVIIEHNGHDFLIDQRAEMNLMGALMMQAQQLNWITKDDASVPLTAADLQAIALKVQAYREETYAIKTQSFTAINAAQTVEEIELIMQ